MPLFLDGLSVDVAGGAVLLLKTGVCVFSLGGLAT